MSRARLRALILGALLPAGVLVVDPRAYAPFGPLRWMAVSVIAVLAVASVAWRGYVDVSRRAGVAWLVFGAWVVVCASVGVDPVYAWIGTAERHFGALTWLVCGLLFVAGHTLDDDADRRVVLGIAVATVGLAGGWAVAEELGWDPVRLAASTRLVGSLGSAAYLGAAMALGLPLALGVALDRSWSPLARWGASAAGALALAALVGSGARAAWVGVVGAGAVLVVTRRPVGAWAARDLRRTAAIVGVALVGLIAVGAVSGSAGRITGLVDGNGGGGTSRLAEWRVGLAVVAAHPATGVGPEGYRVTFPAVVTVGYQQTYGRAPLPDRVHDGLLDVAATTGIPGLAVYVALLALCGVLLLRAVRQAEPWVCGVAVGVLAYLIQELFLFPIGELEPAVWLLIGLVAACVTRPDERVRLVIPRAVSALAVGCALVAAVAGARDVAADHDTRAALSDLAAGRVTAAQHAADRAVALRPDQIDYRLAAARADAATPTVAGIDRGLGQLADGLGVSPGDPIVRQQTAALLVERAQLTDATPDISAARAYLSRLVAGDPFNPETELQLGVALALGGDRAGAQEAWTDAAWLAPADAAPLTNLATLYAGESRWAQATADARLALARDPSDQRAARVLAEGAARDGT
jgi:O-antigen ligase/Flp pilus assembly protein TadD